MDNNIGNLKPKPKSGGPKKLHPDYLLALLNKTAAAFRIDLTEATQAVYLEILQGYSADKLEYAITRTIQEWPEASKMPTLNFILTRLADYSSERNGRLLFDRPDKPADWEPLKPGEASALLAGIKRQAAAESEALLKRLNGAGKRERRL